MLFRLNLIFLISIIFSSNTTLALSCSKALGSSSGIVVEQEVSVTFGHPYENLQDYLKDLVLMKDLVEANNVLNFKMSSADSVTKVVGYGQHERESNTDGVFLIVAEFTGPESGAERLPDVLNKVLYTNKTGVLELEDTSFDTYAFDDQITSRFYAPIMNMSEFSAHLTSLIFHLKILFESHNYKLLQEFLSQRDADEYDISEFKFEPTQDPNKYIISVRLFGSRSRTFYDISLELEARK